MSKSVQYHLDEFKRLQELIVSVDYKPDRETTELLAIAAWLAGYVEGIQPIHIDGGKMELKRNPPAIYHDPEDILI